MANTDILTGDELDSSSDDEDYNVEDHTNIDSADDDANSPKPLNTEQDDEDIGTEIKSAADLAKEGLVLIEGYESVRTPIKELKSRRAAPNEYQILLLGTAYEIDKFNKRGFTHPDVSLTDLAIIADKTGKTQRALFLSDEDGELSFLLANARCELNVIKRTAAKLDVKMDCAKWISYKGKPNTDCLSPKELLLFGNMSKSICLSDIVLDAKKEEQIKLTKPKQRKRPRVIEDDPEDPLSLPDPPSTTSTTSTPTPAPNPTITSTRKRKSRVQLQGTPQKTPTKITKQQTLTSVLQPKPVEESVAEPVKTPDVILPEPSHTPSINTDNAGPKISVQMEFYSLEQFKSVMKCITTR